MPLTVNVCRPGGRVDRAAWTNVAGAVLHMSPQPGSVRAGPRCLREPVRLERDVLGVMGISSPARGAARGPAGWPGSQRLPFCGKTQMAAAHARQSRPDSAGWHRRRTYAACSEGWPSLSSTLALSHRPEISPIVTNRSVPASTVMPHLAYSDVAAASAWLSGVFGFSKHYRYGPPGAPSGAQTYLGDAWIMLDAADTTRKTPAELSYGTQSLTVLAADAMPTSREQNLPAPRSWKNFTRPSKASASMVPATSPVTIGSSPLTPATSAPPSGVQ